MDFRATGSACDISFFVGHFFVYQIGSLSERTIRFVYSNKSSAEKKAHLATNIRIMQLLSKLFSANAQTEIRLVAGLDGSLF